MAKVVDFTWDQGSRWMGAIQPVVDWLPSLSGYSARGKIKESRTLSGAAVLFDMQPYMTVDVANGLVLIDIPANVMAAISWTTGAYDMELFDSDVAHDVRFLQGTITVDKETTV